MFHGGEDLDESVEHDALGTGYSDTLEKSYLRIRVLTARAVSRICCSHLDGTRRYVVRVALSNSTTL
jgi:hypothetical protein